MKIKKFNEVTDVDISTERVNEIIEELSKISVIVDTQNNLILKLSEELSNYKSNSKKENDQIDDAIINLDVVKSKLDDSISSLDDISVKLKSYTEDGRKFLY